MRSQSEMTNRKHVLLRVWPQTVQRILTTKPSVLARFIIIGGFTAIFYFTVLIGLFYVVGFTASLSGALAFIIALIPNYVLQKRATFRFRAGHGSALPKYLVMILGGLTLNVAILEIGVVWLAIDLVRVQAVAVIAVLIWNFALMQTWVFFDKSETPTC